jgi:putative Mg2+ transporter-C (MgtC) family protein
MINLDATVLITRLVTAVVLGGLAGLEREAHRKPAGLRTHMMVALGAAAFTVSALGLEAADGSTDPSRIIQGVATGIGFLGAGSILRKGRNVEGLTTAAGIWVLGAVGVACALGDYTLAVSVTLLSALTLSLVGWLERVVSAKLDRG